MTLFSLQDISKYRAELMGFAILGVLLGHIIAFSGWDMPILDSIAHGIHTPGFLFLSGFGLFYSLSKNSDAADFYKRRFWRFYLPFVLMVLPFLFRPLLSGNFNLWSFACQISTINFWLYGNNNGMWYIAVSAVLYIITPPIYQFITYRQKAVLTRLILVILCMIGINYGIKTISDSYWNMVEIGMKHIPMFFIGMMVAYLAKIGISDRSTAISAIVITAIYIAFEVSGLQIPYLGAMSKTLFYTILICITLSLLNDVFCSYISRVLAWFGKYTLELYVLHLFLDAFLRSPIFHINHRNGIILACVLSVIVCVPVHNVIQKITELIQSNHTK